MKYAIVNKNGEFYADPIYTDITQAMEKIKYLNQYRVDNQMEDMAYDIEPLSEAREAQHNQEWQTYRSMID